MWGRNVMMGYLGREDKTTEDVDPEGWMHSGDMATKDGDDFYYITGEFFAVLGWSGVVVVVVVVLAAAAAAVVVVVVVVVVVPVVVALAVVVVVVPAAAAVVVVPAAADVVSGGGAAAVGGPPSKGFFDQERFALHLQRAGGF